MKKEVRSILINKILLVFSFSLLINIQTKAQEYLWMDQSKKVFTGDSYYNYGVRTSALSDAYVFGGIFASQISLGNDTIIANEASDPFNWPYHPDIAVYATDEEGNFEWLHYFGADYYIGENINEIITDKDDNIYISAFIKGDISTFKWDGDPMTIESAYIIIKLNRQGELLSIKPLDYNPLTMHIDSKKNLYVAGNFSSTQVNIDGIIFDVDSDGGSSSNTVIVKYDSNIKAVWANTAGPVGSTWNASVSPIDITTNDIGEAVIIGNYIPSTTASTNQHFEFDTISFTSALSDGFIAFLDTLGNFTKVIPRFHSITAIKHIKDNQIALACNINLHYTIANEIDTIVPSSANYNSCIIVFDMHTLETSYLKYLHGNNRFAIIDLETNNDNLIFVGGSFESDVYTDSSSISSSHQEIFIFQLDMENDLESLTKHGYSNWGTKMDMSYDKLSGNLSVIGRLDGTQTFLNQELSYSGPGSDIVFGLFNPKILGQSIVRFESQGGTEIPDIVTPLNTKISAPDEPTKTGYTFDGWCKEEECITLWNFDTDFAISDLTLYAKWIINVYVVHFNTLGGSAIADIEAEYDTHITIPTEPTKVGHTFDGWFIEEDCINSWGFENDTITSDSTLYAKWLINNYTVSFNTLGGSDIADITTKYNTSIVAPNEPIKTGYTFVGWYIEETCTNPWIFGTDVVVSDTTLYTKWTIISGFSNISGIINLSIFPNPAANNIKVNGEKLHTILIMDLSGKTQIHVNPNGKDNTTIDLSNLQTGVYIIKLINIEGKISKVKIIKE